MYASRETRSEGCCNQHLLLSVQAGSWSCLCCSARRELQCNSVEMVGTQASAGLCFVPQILEALVWALKKPLQDARGSWSRSTSCPLPCLWTWCFQRGRKFQQIHDKYKKVPWSESLFTAFFGLLGIIVDGYRTTLSSTCVSTAIAERNTLVGTKHSLLNDFLVITEKKLAESLSFYRSTNYFGINDVMISVAAFRRNKPITTYESSWSLDKSLILIGLNLLTSYLHHSTTSFQVEVTLSPRFGVSIRDNDVNWRPTACLWSAEKKNIFQNGGQLERIYGSRKKAAWNP